MKTLLVVFLFLFFNGLLLSQTDFRLTRPADWNSTVNQVQLDFNGKLAEKVRDIPGTAKITLSADCDGVLDKMLNFRFPDATNFEKIDDSTYLFAAKTSIIDFCKVLKIDVAIFYEVEGDFDSIAGLFLELYGNIPKKGTRVFHHNFIFTVESLDNRRIKKLKVEITNEK